MYPLTNSIKVWDTKQKLTMRQLTINMAIITEYVCNINTFFIFYDLICRFVHCSVQHLLPSIIHWPLKLEPKLSFLLLFTSGRPRQYTNRSLAHSKNHSNLVTETAGKEEVGLSCIYLHLHYPLHYNTADVVNNPTVYFVHWPTICSSVWSMRSLQSWVSSSSWSSPLSSSLRRPILSPSRWHRAMY